MKESNTLKRKAFTLFELMIVVVIIGVVYALVLSNFNTKKKVRIYKIKNIKEALMPYWEKGKQLDFVLYDKCQKSALFINDIQAEKFEPLIKASEFDKIEVYKPDYRGEGQKQEFIPRLIDNTLHDICFQYTLFPNGSNSSYIVKKKNIYYIFYPYFQDVNVSENLENAIEILTLRKYKGVRADELND